VVFCDASTEISITLLGSMKAMFAGQEVEIIVKSVEPEQQAAKKHSELSQMIRGNRFNAPR
jgi:hypothetical protein